MAFIGNTNTTQAFTPAIDYFSGTGSATAFTLSRPVASVAQVQVTIDNVAQNPSSAYTVSGSTITFTSAPLSGTNNIYVYYTSPITQVIAPGQGTVNTTALGNITNIASGNSSLTLQTGSSPTTAVTIDTSQNVGIGGALLAGAPGGAAGKVLALAATQYPQSIMTATSGTTGNKNVRFIYRDSGVFQLQTLDDTYGSEVTAYEVQRSTTGITYQAWVTGTAGSTAERMRIDSSGNVLVGTTSALSQTGRATFVGTGNAVVTQVANGNTAYQSTNTSGTGAYYAAIWSNNGNTFSTCGTIQVSGTTTSYNTSSDYRLKENIQPMTGALAKVALLKPVTYKWKSDGTNGEGFIAHELAEICPNAVTGEKDALKEDGSIMPQGIDTSFLVATLTAAIQELKAINDTQAATITALTARIVALENR